MVSSDNVPVAINVFCKQTIRASRSRVFINQLDLDESYQYINELVEESTAILTDPNSFRFSFIGMFCLNCTMLSVNQLNF